MTRFEIYTYVQMIWGVSASGAVIKYALVFSSSHLTYLEWEAVHYDKQFTDIKFGSTWAMSIGRH